MPISTSSDGAPLAIRFQDVSKTFWLQGAKARGLFGGSESAGPRYGAKGKPKFALQNISMEIARGGRLGLIGRNGAGKTTLLKLIAGNHKPTTGIVEVNGSVQALMTVGYGMHPEQTGLENIKNSLRYNGLPANQMDGAIADVVEFCELGDYLYEPFKTYSTGMQSRLMFAAATAINPDILIVDEILGAGDAYFVAKSKLRVQRLVGSGCTMLLVSHSMAQVLELCENVIWLEDGRVRMAGDALTVVKAYEEFMYGPIHRLEADDEEEQLVGHDAGPVASNFVKFRAEPAAGAKLQHPFFMPHARPAKIEPVGDGARKTFSSLARGGLSRWESDEGVKVTGFTVRSATGKTGVVTALQPAVFTVFLEGEKSGHFRCTYGIAIHDLQGNAVTRIWSPTDVFDIERGQSRRIDIVLNPNQIGPGEYTVGISVLGESSMESVNAAKRYDLLGRSFSLKVELPDTLSPISAQFFHTAEWAFRPVDEGVPLDAEAPADELVE